MITNEVELAGTQERIALFFRIVANIRATAQTPKEYYSYANGYLAEIEKMNAEVLVYLRCSPQESSASEAA